MEASSEGVEVQVVLAGQQSAAAQKLADQAPAQQVNTTQANAPVSTIDCTSPDRCWSSKTLWTAFALGWLFPPCWWAAAAAGLKSGGDSQCLVVKRRGLNPSQTAAWRASVLMSLLSCVVLVLVLSIYYGQPSRQQDGPYFLTLTGPADAFPDLNNPTSRRLIAEAVHKALNLDSTYPIHNILVWVQKQQNLGPNFNFAAPSRRRLSDTGDALLYVVGYALVKSPQLPSAVQPGISMASKEATERLAEKLADSAFLPSEDFGRLSVGLTSWGDSDAVVQHLKSTAGQGGSIHLTPIGKKDPVCIGNPQQPVNGSFACPSPALPGSVCNATCEAGYDGIPSSTCQPDGTYSAVTGSCELIVCTGDPPHPGNGSFVDCLSPARPGSVCNATCDAGYAGVPSSTCQPDGTYGDVTGSCELIVCRDNPPQQPVNGSFACPSPALPGSVCNATCGVGYAGVPSSTCQPDGTYGAVTGSCELIVCTGNPQQPDNGGFDCPSPALPGSACNATCNAGHAGAPSATCQPDGTYSAVTGACELIVCTGNPLQPTNGGSFDCRSPAYPGNVCGATCDAGYAGNPIAQCESDGTCSAVTGACEPIVCRLSPSNPALDGAIFVCPSTANPGSVCNATCDTGYAPAMSGAPFATCQSDGTFAVTGSCERIVCTGNPPSPPIGWFTCSLGPPAPVGSKCTATCPFGHVGAPPPSATCQPDGTYSDVTGACTQDCNESAAPVTAVTILTHTNLPGNDIPHPSVTAPAPCGMVANNVEECIQLCASKPFCKGFTYLPSSSSSSCVNACFLKKSPSHGIWVLDKNTSDATVMASTSGIMPIVVADAEKRVNYDYPGSDQSVHNCPGDTGSLSDGLTYPNMTAEMCAAGCARRASAGCRAYAYIAEPVNGLCRGCYLKNDVPPLEMVPGITAGVVSGTRATYSHLVNSDFNVSTDIQSTAACTFSGTLEQCASLCADTPSCTAFVLSPDNPFFSAVNKCTTYCVLKSSTDGIIVPRAGTVAARLAPCGNGVKVRCLPSPVQWDRTEGVCKVALG